MKTNNLIFFLTFIISLAFNNTKIFSQDRKVAWVNGLGETNAFWQNYSKAFQFERKINSNNNTYFTKNGVVSMASYIRGAVSGYDNNVGIGHSMGAVALRDIDRSNPGFFSAYITVGSPMNGANIANSINNGSAASAIASGIGKVLRGPTSSGIPVPVYDNLAADIMVNLISKFLLEPQLNPSGYGVQTLADLSKGGSYMNNIANFAGNRPAISIQGIENGPVHWRMASTTLQGEGNANDDDERVVKAANTLYDVYNAFYIVNSLSLNFYSASQWKDGRDYIRDDSQSDYLYMIGAKREETGSYTYQAYMCGGNNLGYDNAYWDCLYYSAGSGSEDCSLYCYQTFTQYYTNIIEEPSDGYIPATSQIGSGTAWQRSTGDIYVAEGANHLQEGNHPNIKAQFNRIYNRTDQFFKIDPR